MMLLLLALACGPGSLPGTDDADDSNTGADTEAGSLLVDSDVESLAGPQSDSASLFDESRLTEIGIELSDAAYRSLVNDPYEWVEGNFIYEGVTYGPIGVRTKGENSWRPITQKTSLKLDFNRYASEGGPDRVLGLKGLTLQAMNEDYSMMHERVGYWFYRKAGVPAVRAHHAVVSLNGELYGLFTVLDSVDDLFLAQFFDDNSGSMWEQHDGDYTDAYVQNNTYFQHEEGEDNREGLQWVADALESGGQAAVNRAGERLSWPAFHRYWAAGGIVMQFDAYPFRFAGDDCHVYDDPTTGLLWYIPHGVDESFYYDYDFESRAAGHLSARCREVQSCRDDWARIVYETLDIAEREDIAEYARQVAEQIADAAQADPNRNYSMSNVRSYQNDMINKLENRRASVESFIARPD